MPVDTLEFEEPIAVLLKEIEALNALPHTDARDREIEQLRRRVESVRGDLYRSLTPWHASLSRAIPAARTWRTSFSGSSPTSSRSTAIAASPTITR